MSDRGVLEWLGKRKEGSVSVWTRDHTVKVLDTVSELKRALDKLSKGDNAAAMKCIERLILSEREADRIEDKLCAEITMGELSIQEREDLIHYVRKMDHIANWSKEASINLQLIIETNASVPSDIWHALCDMADELITTVTHLMRLSETLMKTDVAETQRVIEAVYDQERVVDTIYYDTIKKVHLSTMDPKAIILAREVILAVEMATDTCKTCADTVGIMLTSRS